MSVICGKHKTESKVTKIPGGVSFSCDECNIERAAPKLIEALEESRIYLDDFFGFCDRTENQQGLMEKIDAAIAAAKGQQGGDMEQLIAQAAKDYDMTVEEVKHVRDCCAPDDCFYEMLEIYIKNRRDK